MKKVIFTLMAVAGIWAIAKAERPVGVTIQKVSTAPVIDGSTSDWDNIPEVALTKVFETPGDDMSAAFKMCYDNTNIYVLVKVSDATPNVEADQTWKDDCIELFFAMDTNNAASYRPGDWQIRKVRSKEAPDGIDGSGSIDALKAAEGFQVVEEGDATGYTQEWKLPIATLTETAAFDNKYFRFDIQVANNVAGDARAGSLFWNSTVNDQWSKVENQGLAMMGGATAIENKHVASAKAFVSGNSLNVKGVNGIISVYDITGKLVLKASVSENAQIGISQLHKGIYLVKDANSQLNAKILVQ